MRYIVEQYTFHDQALFINNMKDNQNPSTPSALLSARFRFKSFNSPFISPLMIAQSPSDNDFLQQKQFAEELPHFQLEENEGHQRNHKASFQCKQPVRPQSQEGDKSEKQQSEEEQDILLDQNNMLGFLLKNINRNNKLIEESKKALEGYGTNFTNKLFDYLLNKLLKLRKTKEQMVKYCVRKSFKHITSKMRAANKQAYTNMENNEVVAQYFEKHCEGDLSISMPFQKNSEQKTMNSSFLTKIFKCRQYNIDYLQFLQKFPAEYHADNNRKIKSLNEAIKKCCKNKCFKSLDDYKRLPWTNDILQKILGFAKSLLDYCPYQKSELRQKSILITENEKNKNDSTVEKPQNRKRSVIILTPTSKPNIDPFNFPSDLDILH